MSMGAMAGAYLSGSLTRNADDGRPLLICLDEALELLHNSELRLVQCMSAHSAVLNSGC